MFQIEGTNYMTVRETARRLGVHPGTVRNWRSDGVEPIEGVKLGASVLYRQADVEKLAEERAK
ncbi:helix-turn-helix domain-containing protein [Streptomyces ferrugineus]|uniref:Helix-turn-helix domain-containing protein n=1 Tax=Streptomyces ferrugineus TaxID=1413221 RepID=A0A7M2SQ92_9ACTN|nr:helix-turn-helix domain-containing protein [Streptomyces ferrugineus]QOV37648.1 helix-turn-helix domain-containing protein [Streptomyces ferrugineus]